MSNLQLTDAAQNAIKTARKIIQASEADCVIIRNDAIAEVEHGLGVRPLMQLFQAEGNKLQGVIVVDKVIGRAAAFLAIKGGVAYAHGEIMSQGAVELLNQHNIPNSHTTLVPKILNRTGDDMCPLEKSVLGIEDVDEAITSMKKKIADLMKAKK